LTLPTAVVLTDLWDNCLSPCPFVAPNYGSSCTRVMLQGSSPVDSFNQAQASWTVYQYKKAKQYAVCVIILDTFHHSYEPLIGPLNRLLQSHGVIALGVIQRFSSSDDILCIRISL